MAADARLAVPSGQKGLSQAKQLITLAIADTSQSIIPRRRASASTNARP